MRKKFRYGNKDKIFRKSYPTLYLDPVSGADGNADPFFFIRNVRSGTEIRRLYPVSSYEAVCNDRFSSGKPTPERLSSGGNLRKNPSAENLNVRGKDSAKIALFRSLRLDLRPRFALRYDVDAQKDEHYGAALADRETVHSG